MSDFHKESAFAREEQLKLWGNQFADRGDVRQQMRDAKADAEAEQKFGEHLARVDGRDLEQVAWLLHQALQEVSGQTHQDIDEAYQLIYRMLR